MFKKEHCASEKLAILEEVKSGAIGFMAATKKYGFNKTTMMKWQRRYKLYGYKGLTSRKHKQSYNAEPKLQAVKDNGEAQAMTKGRSTTYQKRIDIVQYCLAHLLCNGVFQ